jgi:hypothetical protein
MADIKETILILNEIISRGAPQRQRLALTALTNMSMIKSGIEEMSEAATATGHAREAKVFARLVKFVSRAAPWLSRLILRVSHLTEWTAGGQIGLPGLAQGSISVTFGSPPGHLAGPASAPRNSD